MKKILDIITDEMRKAFAANGYDENFAKVTLSNRPDLCQYQCNGAMAAAKQYKMAPFQIAEKVVEAVKENDIFEKIEMVKPGFINITVSGKLLVDFGKAMMTEEKFGIPAPEKERTVSLYCAVRLGKLLIEVKNPYAGELTLSPDGRPVTARKGHGYGCQSIQTIAARSGGLCEFKAGCGTFCLQIVLPLKAAAPV